MRFRAVLFPTALLIVLLWSSPGHASGVRADDYSSFWLWGGVRSQPVLARAESLYILQGEVTGRTRSGAADVRVVAQGMPVARIGKGAVWLVYRADTLRWSPGIVQALVSRVHLWRSAGNPVVGLQIDFDVKTRRLREYVEFLRNLRAQLPVDCRLGITGLLDWSSNGDIEAVNRLRDIVDEVIVQTYQGRKTIPSYAAYLPRLRRLALPFKIGLVQNGEWHAPEGFEANPWFRGYVVFLRNLAG